MTDEQKSNASAEKLSNSQVSNDQMQDSEKKLLELQEEKKDEA